MSKVLTAHQAAAEKALLQELRRQGVASQAVTVEVLPQPGGLLVELEVKPPVSRTQAQHIATCIAHAVHRHDRRVATVETAVHFMSGTPTRLAGSSY